MSMLAFFKTDLGLALAIAAVLLLTMTAYVVILIRRTEPHSYHTDEARLKEIRDNRCAKG